MKDMTLMDAEITVGHIIANPNFDCNCYVRIVHSCDGEEILHQSYGGADCPAELLVKNVSYITIRNDMLTIEAKMGEG